MFFESEINGRGAVTMSGCSVREDQEALAEDNSDGGSRLGRSREGKGRVFGMTDDRVFSDQYGPLRPRWDRLLVALSERGAYRTVDSFAPGLTYDQAERILEEAGFAPGAVRGQILDLFKCVNGFAEGQWTRVFPDVDLLSLREMISVRAMMLEVAGARSGYPSYAGFPAYGFVPEYIPFAERDGYLLVADLRTGSQWGEVLRYDKIDADDSTTSWPSVASVLDNLIGAIANGSDFDGWTAEVVDGELTWSLR
ncbi:hypothetical protein [Williamsia sp. R60]